MPGHAPYLMPDGQPLSKYLTLENEVREEKRKKKRQKGRPRGKDEIWEHLKRQQCYATESGYHSEHGEFSVAEKMGSRRRTRWMNDRMLRDMTGPMTMDQIEAQFCPPPWGDIPTKKEPFDLLCEQHRSLWELLQNIDLESEQKLIHDLESCQPKSAPAQDGAKAALESWQLISHPLREFMKSANPTVVLEVELQLMEFKRQRSEKVWRVENTSRYLLLIYEALCQFHRLRWRHEARMAEAEMPDRRYDLKIQHRRNSTEDEGLWCDGVEVTCADILMALQERKLEPLNSKSLRKFIATHIHCIEDAH